MINNKLLSFEYSTLGNRFLLIDSLPVHPRYPRSDIIALLSPYPQTDGLLLLDPKTRYTEIYNKDGSYGQFSGNGLRCIAAHLKHQYSIEHARIKMGNTFFTCEMVAESITSQAKPGKMLGTLSVTCPYLNTVLDALLVDVGNPHALFINTELAHLPGAELEHITTQLVMKNLQPHAINISFIDGTAMKTIERGVGYTQSCSSAILAYATYLSKINSDKIITIDTPGGPITVKIEDNGISLTAKMDFLKDGEKVPSVWGDQGTSRRVMEYHRHSLSMTSIEINNIIA